MSLSFQELDESMKDDSDNLQCNRAEEFDNILCDVEMLIDKELHNTWPHARTDFVNLLKKF